MYVAFCVILLSAMSILKFAGLLFSFGKGRYGEIVQHLNGCMCLIMMHRTHPVLASNIHPFL